MGNVLECARFAQFLEVIIKKKSIFKPQLGLFYCMKKCAGIYTITSPSNKIYVGQSINLRLRKSYYKRNIEAIGQPKIHNSIKKYGWAAHKFEVIFPLKEGVSQENLDYWECFFMKFYRDNGFELMNIQPGGLRGRTITEETRRKMSLSLKGKNKLGHPRDEETKKLIGFANTGEKSGRTTLTNKQVRIITHCLKFGIRVTELSKIFNVKYHLISSIRTGKSWSLISGISQKASKDSRFPRAIRDKDW